MDALRVQRQQLVRLTPDGWSALLAATPDEAMRPCLALWAERGLPLVVTRQPCGASEADEAIATGLPAPARWQRRRLALAIAPRHVLLLDAFPAGAAIARELPRALAGPWRALLGELSAAGCAPRVYGGYGWQALTRLAYVHAASDLDLLLPVDSMGQADAVVRVLSSTAWADPRLDGELLFPDGGAIAWREWAAWREGRTSAVLVKRLRGVALENPVAEFA